MKNHLLNLKKSSKTFWGLLLLLLVVNPLAYSEVMDPSDPTPIEAPTMACEKHTIDDKTGEDTITGAFIFSQKGNEIKIWQAETGKDIEGLPLETISIETRRCFGCYVAQAKFTIWGQTMNYLFEITNMNVEHIGKHLKPSVKITLSSPDSDDEPVTFSDFICWNFKKNSN